MPSVSNARLDWTMSKLRISGLLQFSLDWVPEKMEERWNELMDSVIDDDSAPAPGDLLDDETGGYAHHFGEWVLGAALKDAVTAFEVYLEQARHEALAAVGLTSVEKGSPRFDDLKAFYLLLDVAISPEAVAKVRKRRHILTHAQGKLDPTELDQKLSHTQPDFGRLQLTRGGVLDDVEHLNAVVHVADPAIMAVVDGEDSRFEKRLADWALKQAKIVGIRS